MTLEQIKTNINLVDFSLDYGFEIDKNKSSKSSIKLEKGDIKIIVSKYNHYIFFDLNNQEIKGTIIDFYKNYIDNKKSFKDIINELKNYKNNDNNIIINTQNNTPEKLKDLDKLNYYLKSRFIDNDTFNVFKNTIKIDNNNNTCFIHKNYSFENQKYKMEMCGIEKKNTNFKGHINKKGLCGLTIQNGKNIYIFESPIDLMSYYQIYKKNGSYISLGGSFNNTQLQDLKSVILKSKSNRLICCFDNDDGGEKLNNKLYDFIKNINMEYETHKPKLKDFNNDLTLKTFKDISNNIEQEKTQERGL